MPDERGEGTLSKPTPKPYSFLVSSQAFYFTR